MTTIVTRAGKGTPLTNTEVDTNFTNLNTDKLELGGTFSSGTANSVLYLNGSKVLTTGSALTFDGTNLVNTSSSVGTPEIAIENSATSAGANARLRIKTGGSGSTTYGDAFIQFTDSLNWNWSIGAGSSTSNNLTFNQYFGLTSNELMRLTSTGLGIGTSSPVANTPLTLQTASGYTDILWLKAVGTNVDSRINIAPTGTGLAQINNTVGTAIALQISGSEKMRLDSSGNLGLGVTPTANYGGLQVVGPTSSSLFTQQGIDVVRMGVRASGRTGIVFDSSNATYTNRMWYIDNQGSAGSLVIGRQGLDVLTMDNSGNLGLGVTPSAWESARKAIQLSGTASYFAANSVAVIAANNFFDGENKYIGTGYATQYGQSAGQHIWLTAASGTAGNAISFTQAMTLDASGFLVVGDTTTGISRFTSASTSYPETTEYAGVFKAGTVSPLSNRYLFLRQTYTGGAFDSLPLVWEANADGANQKSYGVIQTIADGSIVFSNKAAGAAVAIGTALGVAERARITSGGTFQTSLDASIYGVTVGRGAGAVSTNTAVGASALAANTSGDQNAAFGTNALSANTTGAGNSAFGRNSLVNNTTGATNTAVGVSALQANTTADNNTAIGYQAGYSNTTGTQNTYVGRTAGYSSTVGSYNFAAGFGALYANTGSNNAASGYYALAANTSGAYNTAHGAQALYSNTTASNNTAIGYQALYTKSTGSSNTAVGYQAIYTDNGGIYNTALGHQALTSQTAADYNTAIGTFALYSNTTASSGTAVGYQALYSNQTGPYIEALGYQAAYNSTSGRITALGYKAAYATTTGQYNTAVGTIEADVGLSALGTNTTGAYNTAVGGGALGSSTTVSYNTALGYQAGARTTTGHITAVGSLVLSSNTTGENNVGMGGADGVFGAALGSNTTGSYNTGIGVQALKSNTTASYNTAVGYQAGYSNTTGTSNVAIGYLALYTNSTSSRNTAVGQQAMYYTTGADNSAFGDTALRNNSTGAQNTALGSGALFTSTTASYNTAVGYQAAYSNTTGPYLTALGYRAGYSNTTADQNTLIGFDAGYATTGASNTAVGAFALTANTTGNNNTSVGTGSMLTATTGAWNAAFGRNALRLQTTGNYNTAVGGDSLYSNTTADSNTAVGYQAGYTFAGSSGINTLIGTQAGYSMTGTNSADYGNTFVGYRAGYVVAGTGTAQTGIYNTFIGTSAGSAVTTGAKNTIIGRYNGNDGGLDIRAASNYIVLSDGDGNPRQIIDSSGNLGLGVTPSTWNGIYKVLQVGTANFNSSSSYTNASFGSNYFRNAGNAAVRINADYATSYDQDDGIHSWSTAGTGAAGSTFTFTQAMTLDASGNLLVGNTTQYGTANRAAVFSANKFGLSIIDTTAQATGVGGALNLGGNYRTTGDAQAFVRVAAAKENSTDNNYAYAMTFSTTPNGGTFTEAARITSGGYLGISTNNPLNYLDLGQASNGNGLTWGNYSNVFSEYSSGALILSSNYYGNIGSGGYKTTLTATFGAAGIQVSGTSGAGNGGLIQFFVDPATSKTAGNAFTPSEKARITSGGNLLVGETASNSGNNGLKVKGQFALTTAQTFTASGSVNDSAYYIVCYSLSATCTLTLPTPANNTGRLLNIVVQSAQQVVSASSNVTAIADGSVGTAILPATAGKWAQLWCDGAYWNIIATNV